LGILVAFLTIFEILFLFNSDTKHLYSTANSTANNSENSDNFLKKEKLDGKNSPNQFRPNLDQIPKN